MKAPALIEQLVAAGLADDFAAVASLPGAGNHAQVLWFASSLRGAGRRVVDDMAPSHRVAFVKALAVYENTVSGLGSVTGLRDLLPLAPGAAHELIDWVLSSTRSYDHYSHGARSLDEFMAMKAAHAERRAERESNEAERARQARARREERATANLRNAVRRGDLGAVKALLSQRAAVDGGVIAGEPLDRYAEELGHVEIAVALRRARQKA